MSIEIIGAGLGRTGTLSLKAALEELGFTKCYHMVEVFTRGDDAQIWDAALRGEPVDWDRFFAGYRATVDLPSCLFYRERSARGAVASASSSVCPSPIGSRSRTSTTPPSSAPESIASPASCGPSAMPPSERPQWCSSLSRW